MVCTLEHRAAAAADTCRPSRCATCGWDDAERARRLELVRAGRLTKFPDGTWGLRVPRKNWKRGGEADEARMRGEES